MGLLSALRKYRPPPSHQFLPPALFPTGEYTTSVTTWASSIQDLAENRECRLRRIVHCKAKSGSRDEFLLVYVRHPSGKNAIVLADRDTSFDPSSAYVDEDTVPPYSRMDMRALGVAPSRDRIRLSSDGTVASLIGHIPGGWAEIHTVKFPKASEAPSVAHLAVLLTVVHRHMVPPGAKGEGRSGWFAYCVAEVMSEIFLGKSKTNKKWVRVPYGGIKAEGRDTVDALIREFKPAWEDFSRRQTLARGGGRSTEHKSKRQEEKKAKKKALMASFVDMLRTMES
ncbi:hypothetical protein OG21DRAFT_1499593 [Imleria badia]|nr:hypothetical protein OG21DRAFT_1499593 [Imleria badia]